MARRRKELPPATPASVPVSGAGYPPASGAPFSPACSAASRPAFGADTSPAAAFAPNSASRCRLSCRQRLPSHGYLLSFPVCLVPAGHSYWQGHPWVLTQNSTCPVDVHHWTLVVSCHLYQFLSTISVLLSFD
ncbi:hypothetical protein ABZP36_011074 [Zizania latifolia]